MLRGIDRLTTFEEDGSSSNLIPVSAPTLIWVIFHFLVRLYQLPLIMMDLCQSQICRRILSLGKRKERILGNFEANASISFFIFFIIA
jgi:hypothetical protein